MITKAHLQLLRFPFSYLLLPTFLFAWSQSENYVWWELALVFAILHFLVYPSSNGYNSYVDDDEGSIGALKNPPKSTYKLFRLTLFIDWLAILLAFTVGKTFALLLFLYIVASRLYSARFIRLKKYPFLGFLTVFVFQGALTYLMVYQAINNVPLSWELLNQIYVPMIISSLLIGSIYPLTQIYQHEEDLKNGDRSLSYQLGYTGTFLFSGLLFSIGVALFYPFFQERAAMDLFYSLLLFTLPTVLFFFYWFFSVLRNKEAANFKNTMIASLTAATCMNAFFILNLLQ